MRRGTILAIILILLAIGLTVWMYRSAFTRDTGIAPSGEMSEELSEALEGRVLVWSTNANVPLKLMIGPGNRRGIFRGLGVPEYLRPYDFDMWREPASEEMNLAIVQIDGEMGELTPRFLTYDQGAIHQGMVSADGNYIVATHQFENAQNIVRFDTDTGDVKVVVFSRSVDHWPSCNADGSIILFHSYRDQNPGGDLYLAIEDETAADGWKVVRLTDRADVEYVWPKISADGNWCVAVERVIGEQKGCVILWELTDETLAEPEYLTSEPELVHSPSLNASGTLCCWALHSQNLRLWKASDSPDREGHVNPIMIEAGESEDGNTVKNWPVLTADGKFIVFLDWQGETREAQIGIYDIQNQSILYLKGSANSMYCTSMSNQVRSDSE